MSEGLNISMVLVILTQHIQQRSWLSCSFYQLLSSCMSNEQSDLSAPVLQLKVITDSMIDRLAELRNMAGVMGSSYSEEQLDLNKRDQDYQDNEEENQFGQKFAEEIKSVRSMIGGLNSNNKKMQNIKNHYAKAIKSAQERQDSQEMNAILLENADYQAKIKEKLIAIEKSVKQAEKNQPKEPETRMKRNFYLNLSKEVSEALLKQQKFEEQFKFTLKDKVTRQVKLIDRDLTPQQVENYVNDPEAAQKMLQKKIWGEASIQIKNTVSDIQDKLRDIQKLQVSVQQCVQLFNQLSALVFAQGEKIDSIEANVNECKDYIQKAEKKLVQGKKHLQCSKKCMCVVIIAALVILIIVIIVVVGTK